VLGDINFASSDIQSNAIDVVVIRLLVNRLVDRQDSARKMNSAGSPGHELVVNNALEKLTEMRGGWTHDPLSKWQDQFGQLF